MGGGERDDFERAGSFWPLRSESSLSLAPRCSHSMRLAQKKRKPGRIREGEGERGKGKESGQKAKLGDGERDKEGSAGEAAAAPSEATNHLHP